MKMKLTQIDGRRLCKATGITLVIALALATIVLLGKYAPSVLLVLGAVLCTAFFYFVLSMLED